MKCEKPSYSVSCRGAIADVSVTDTIGEAVSGDKMPKEAAQRAAERAQRFYEV